MSTTTFTLACPYCPSRLQRQDREYWICPCCFAQFWSLEEWTNAWNWENYREGLHASAL